MISITAPSYSISMNFIMNCVFSIEFFCSPSGRTSGAEAFKSDPSLATVRFISHLVLLIRYVMMSEML